MAFPRSPFAKAHPEAVYCLAFLPDGKHLVTAGADKTGRIWDVERIISAKGKK
jgi:WD40 repeat protein